MILKLKNVSLVFNNTKIIIHGAKIHNQSGHGKNMFWLQGFVQPIIDQRCIPVTTDNPSMMNTVDIIVDGNVCSIHKNVAEKLNIAPGLSVSKQELKESVSVHKDLKFSEKDNGSFIIKQRLLG